MIFDKEFIWYSDHFVYHITETSNIDGIRENGLIPFCGDRSRSVGDTIKAIYFLDYPYNIEEWVDLLFEDSDKNNLELLRFNLKRRKWYMGGCWEYGEFYTMNPVLPNRIDLLKRVDEKGNIYTLDNIVKQKKLIWEPLQKLH